MSTIQPADIETQICGAPKSSKGFEGEPCQHPVKHGGRCHQHRDDVPCIEDAPKQAVRRVAPKKAVWPALTAEIHVTKP